MQYVSAVVVAIGLVSSACGAAGSTHPTPSGSVAAASASASSVISPGEVPQGRPATRVELDAMIRAGKKPAESYLHVGDSDSCASQQYCLFTDPAWGVVGIHAGFFHGQAGCPSGCGGAGCWIYLFEDGSGWHFVDAVCAQATGDVPGPQDVVRVSGCANVRSLPGSTGPKVECLPDQTTVDVDSGPVYTDGKIWWHLRGHGWMAHDFLIAPPPPAPS
jgi:hypothetical protein